MLRWLLKWDIVILHETLIATNVFTKEQAQSSKHLLQDAKIRDQRVKLEEIRKEVTEIELAMVKLTAAPGYRCQKIYFNFVLHFIEMSRSI